MFTTRRAQEWVWVEKRHALEEPRLLVPKEVKFADMFDVLLAEDVCNGCSSDCGNVDGYDIGFIYGHWNPIL
jgi:hypothetical protein